MFCMKCGKPTEDGQTICPECAAAAQPVQEQPVEIPVEEPVFQPPVEEPVMEAPAEEPAANAPAEEAFDGDATTSFTAETAENLFDLNFSSQLPDATTEKKVKFGGIKNKKMFGWIVSGVVALAVVTVGLLGFLAWDWGDWFQNLFWSMKPAQEYKNSVEEKALTDEDANSEVALLKKGLVSVYGALVNSAQVEEAGAEMQLDVEIGDELISMLEMAVGSQLPEGMEIPNKASITIDSSGTQEIGQADMGISLNDVQLLQIRYIIDLAEEMGYFGILSPDKMAEEYLSIDISEVMAAAETSMQLTEMLADLPSQEEFAAMLDRYILLAVEQIQEVEKENETVEADGVKQKFTVLTYEVSEETLKDIVIAVLEEAEDDETLYQIVQVFCNLANEMSAMQAQSYGDYYEYYEPEYYDPDDLFDQIPAAIEQMEEVEADDEALFTVNTYVDNKGNICGRKIEVDEADAEIFYITAISGNKVGILAEIDIEGQGGKIEGSGKIKKDQITATLTVEAAKQELVILELEGFDRKAYTGTIRIKLGDDAKDLLEENMGGSMGVAGMLDIADIAIELNLGTNSVGISLTTGGKKMISATLSAAMKDAEKVTVPNATVSVEDEKALEQWLNNLDMDKLADQLKKAGLPDEIVDAVREATPSDLFAPQAAEPDFYEDYESSFSF